MMKILFVSLESLNGECTRQILKRCKRRPCVCKVRREVDLRVVVVFLHERMFLKCFEDNDYTLKLDRKEM